MGNLNGYDANEYEPPGDFSPIPDGEYLVAITGSEMKLTRNAQETGNPEDGEYLELTMEVLEGDFKGRMLWDRLNLKNPSEMAVKIAKGQLSGICRAVGRMNPEDSTDLHDIPLIARVAIEKRSDNGQPTNKVKGYKPAEGADPAPAREPAPRREAAATASRTTATKPGNGGRKPPYARG